MIVLTENGETKVRQYIKELEAHRKEILDAGRDTAEDTHLPTEDDIIEDIEDLIDDEGTYWNGWGVTDMYDHEPLFLQYGEDFMRKVTDIDWNTDGKDIDLPSEVELTKYVPEKRIADALSDMYGVCVNHFEI